MDKQEDVILRINFKEVLDDFSVLASDLHRRDWESHLRKVLRRIGYQSYLLSLGPSTTSDLFNRIMTTYSSGWVRRYKDGNFIQVDPIIRHCHHHFAPLFWGLARRQARGRSNQLWIGATLITSISRAARFGPACRVVWQGHGLMKTAPYSDAFQTLGVYIRPSNNSTSRTTNTTPRIPDGP